MTDPNTTPTPGDGGDGSKTTQTSEQTVPTKKYTADLTEKENAIQSLQRSLEEAQSSLTSPEYLRYLADKKAQAAQAATTAKSTDSQGKDASEDVKALRERLASLEVVSSQLAATLELQDVERRYPDFKDFRSEVHKIIQANGNVTFEQAYFEAKGRKGPGTPPPPSGDKQTHGTEKPGAYIPDATTTTKEFKTSDEASADAARQIREKYGVVDTL